MILLLKGPFAYARPDSKSASARRSEVNSQCYSFTGSDLFDYRTTFPTGNPLSYSGKDQFLSSLSGSDHEPYSSWWAGRKA